VTWRLAGGLSQQSRDWSIDPYTDERDVFRFSHVGEGVQGSIWDERAVGADRRRSQGYTLQIPRICTGAAAATIEGFSSFRPGFPTAVESPRFGRTKRQPLPARLDRVFRRCSPTTHSHQLLSILPSSAHTPTVRLCGSPRRRS
jgi:hypothetical protein